MSQSPIYTVIKNNSNVDRTIRWTGEGPVWIGAGATVELPYEAWSKADRNKRVSMIADIQSRATSVSLKVMQADGTYLAVPYAVSTIMSKPAKSGENVQVKSAPFEKDVEEDDAKHNIKVKSGDAQSAAAHYGATKATEDVKHKAHAEGASINGFQVDSDTQVKGTKQALEEAAAKEAETDKEEADNADEDQKGDTESQGDAEQQDGDEDTDRESESETDPNIQGVSAELPESAARELFAKNVAEKKWESARDTMCTFFGKDKITFSAKTISAMKDWDAIVTKYKLV